MDNRTTELKNEVKNSSTVRLIRELTRWEFHKDEMEAIIKELKQRKSEKEILKMLFMICLVQANFMAAWSEHFYIFDEDEREVRRQLKIGIMTHLTLIVLFLLTSILFNQIISAALIIGYCIWTIKWTLDGYKPIENKIKTTVNKAQ